jgi:hypothetical protein
MRKQKLGYIKYIIRIRKLPLKKFGEGEKKENSIRNMKIFKF